MSKASDRPPIVSFLLAFIGLIAAALFLAALSPTPEQAGDGAPSFDQRSTTSEVVAGQADRSTTGSAR